MMGHTLLHLINMFYQAKKYLGTQQLYGLRKEQRQGRLQLVEYPIQINLSMQVHRVAVYLLMVDLQA